MKLYQQPIVPTGGQTEVTFNGMMLGRYNHNTFLAEANEGARVMAEQLANPIYRPQPYPVGTKVVSTGMAYNHGLTGIVTEVYGLRMIIRLDNDKGITTMQFADAWIPAYV